MCFFRKRPGVHRNEGCGKCAYFTWDAVGDPWCHYPWPTTTKIEYDWYEGKESELKKQSILGDPRIRNKDGYCPYWIHESQTRRLIKEGLL